MSTVRINHSLSTLGHAFKEFSEKLLVDLAPSSSPLAALLSP
jgi:hypothetical protein